MHPFKILASITVAVAGQASAQRTPGSHLCIPTGPGFCQLSIFSTHSPIGHLPALYDSNCRWLGTLSDNDNLLPASGQWSWKSQLPYTIELTLNRPDDRLPRGFFWYKGRKTDLDQGYRNNCNDNDDTTACMRVAFNCS